MTLRRTPLGRSRKAIKTKKRMPSVNRKRAAKKYARNFGAKSDWIRSLDCLACGLPGHLGVQAAHVRPRGMGGCGGDKSDLVPLCGKCHREQEGKAVVKGIDLRSEADRLDLEWRETIERREERWRNT